MRQNSSFRAKRLALWCCNKKILREARQHVAIDAKCDVQIFLVSWLLLFSYRISTVLHMASLPLNVILEVENMFVMAPTAVWLFVTICALLHITGKQILLTHQTYLYKSIISTFWTRANTIVDAWQRKIKSVIKKKMTKTN